MNNQTTGPYEIRTAEDEHLAGARSVMLDTFYHVFGHGYRPEWHADVIDLAATYLRPPRHALFVAAKGDEVVATTAMRAAAPNSPPHPRWLVDRYPAASTAQLFRVYVRPEHRRQGLARALVRRAVQFVAGQPGYRVVYLHSDTRVPGAEAFWRSLASVVHDPRDGSSQTSQTVHFEIETSDRRRLITRLHRPVEGLHFSAFWCRSVRGRWIGARGEPARSLRVCPRLAARPRDSAGACRRAADRISRAGSVKASRSGARRSRPAGPTPAPACQAGVGGAAWPGPEASRRD